MFFYKLMFTSTLFMGTMMTFSSYTWMGAWMGLEINLLSFIPLMKDQNNPMSSESSMKYFLIQALASSVFFLSIILSSIMNNLNSEMITYEFSNMIMNSALLLKMGAAPFHFWFPEIIEGMNWINCLILLTWQKIAPMMLISYSMKTPMFIMFIVIMCSMIGSLGGLNQTSLRKIMAFSSINHIGWMISSLLMSESIWMIYFITYTLISSTFILMLNSFKIFWLKQMFMFMNYTPLIKFSMAINLLSLGGLPPFLGFFPKWLVIQFLSNNYSLMLLIMIMMTLITLFFYLRITYSSFIMNHSSMNVLIIKQKFLTLNSMLTFINLSGLSISTILFNYF